LARVVVDPMRCEGAKDCVKICPERVFAMRKPAPELPWYVKLKVAVHGGRQAYVANESACTACMECVSACPEKAISVTAAAAGAGL
jgi:4Fe-4S ferredoxin